MADSSSQPKAADRRTFLKIGAGVVAGAAIATVVEVPYYSSVMGGNSSSSSSTVSSLKSQLSTTQEQLSSTAAQLNAAQGQVTSLNNQLSSTAAQLTSANSQLSGVSTQLSSTQQALTSANGQITSLSGQVTSANGQITSLQSAVTSANGQITSLQTAVTSANAAASSAQAALDSSTAFQTLGVDEATLIEAIAATFIPTDSNGPGATEAGVVYFIDGQLNGKYGASGHMYMQGPFIGHDLTTSITPVEPARPYTAANGKLYTIGGGTFSAGTMKTVPDNGMRYQYNFNLRSFWHLGLQAVQAYANSAYGGNFEKLSSANQVKLLQDLYNNVPSQKSFSNIVPADFFYELFFMVYSGFTMDPMYGGNKGMVGWLLTGNNGVNMGNFYGEGYTSKQIMVMANPPVLKPASLGQFQKGSP
ncbi:MAG: gluconate 2-dehydrogenase subunit 3 family protein [Thaumarchaeota archaeon]|nr:gluconate 2-dehydrogenase subunit 3 family protein [Nitrososphaerota archaeon]